MKPLSVFFSDLVGRIAKMRPSFRDENQLALAPPPPNTHAVWPTPTAQGLGESRACWDGVRIGVCWHVATWPDWGQKRWLLCLRLMRAGLWSGYRVLQKRRPAGTSCPL